MRTTGRTVAMVLALMLGSTVACGSPAAPSPPSSPSPSAAGIPAVATPSPAAAPVVQIDVAGTGAVSMPATLTPGGYVFGVSCARRATLTVLEPKADYTQAMLVDDLGPQSSQAGSAAAAARFDANTRSLGGVDCASGSRGQFAITLPAGSYWFAALARPGEGRRAGRCHRAGTPTPVTVSGPATTTTLPVPDGTAVAGGDPTRPRGGRCGDGPVECRGSDHRPHLSAATDHRHRLPDRRSRLGAWRPGRTTTTPS